MQCEHAVFCDLSEQLHFGCMLKKSIRFYFGLLGCFSSQLEQTDFYHFQFGLRLQTDVLPWNKRLEPDLLYSFLLFFNWKDWTITVLKEKTPSNQHILFFTIRKKSVLASLKWLVKCWQWVAMSNGCIATSYLVYISIHMMFQRFIRDIKYLILIGWSKQSILNWNHFRPFIPGICTKQNESF